MYYKWCNVLGLESQTMGLPLWKFDSCPGRPCRNGLRITQEVLAGGSIGFAITGYLEIFAGLFPRRQNFYEIF